MNKNKRIPNPRTGSDSFGRINGVKDLNDGEIYLPYGAHIRAHNGFGQSHIWLEHKDDLAKKGIFSIDEVPEYIASLITAQTQVYCEYEIRSRPRATLLKVRDSVIIVEDRGDYSRGIDTYYTIITAYPLRGTPHGALVGKIGEEGIA